MSRNFLTYGAVLCLAAAQLACGSSSSNEDPPIAVTAPPTPTTPTVVTGSPCLNSTVDGSALDASKMVWCAVTFGQSTDVNFATSLLPSQVGTNDVWFNGKKLGLSDAANLGGVITLESRGGKIANTHDGLTFFYTRLSTGVNFKLEADVSVEQFGPDVSLGSTPNGQEGAGLMVRDVNGAPRQIPLVPGYEEFPAASNMAMTALVTQNRKNDNLLAVQTIYRDGVNFPWGNTGAIVPKTTFVPNLNFVSTRTFKLKLERTDSGFSSSYANLDGSGEVSQLIAGANANIVQTIDSKYMYLGFFAARNVKVSFSNAKLELSKANTVNAAKFVAPAPEAVLEVASPSVVPGNDYLLQTRSNYDGTITVTQDGLVKASAVPVVAGQHYALSLSVAAGTSTIELSYVPSGAPNATPVVKTITLTKTVFADPLNLYASPSGTPSGAGTLASPLDLGSAVNFLAPGGTLHLLDGNYSAFTLPFSASGAEGKLKKMFVENAGTVFFTGTLLLDGSYWHLKGIDATAGSTGVTSNAIRVRGSHNVVESVTVHNSGGGGLQISPANANFGRATWPAYNLVLNSESYDNVDAAMKNADGFSAKLGVGDGNIFRGCIAHNNVDDGWDLFNKIEDGANGVITIENSIAYANGKPITLPPGTTAPAVGSIGNGYKLGGEGQPVGHIIRNSIAFDNNMDGFTDNFNPGTLQVSGNIALNNARFNYIFRPGPFSTAAQQGSFSNNVSLRTSPGNYSDAIAGVIDPASNFLYVLDGNKSINAKGEATSTAAYQSITPPLVNGRFQRNPDGSIALGNFLQK